MLTKIAIFNSKKHAKVIINLNDATAIQVVGANKIGKTSLIDCLNFLYIIDKSKMSFDSRGGGSTYTFKESVNHFFPNKKKSFIVFECFKAKAGGYFCVLVKGKTIDDDVEYYKIDKKFEENDYINASGSLMSFSEVDKKLGSNRISDIKDKSDVFNLVYNKDKKRNSFLWIEDNVKRRGKAQSNSLTKIYQFLLNAGSVDNDALKDALIIANSRASTILKVFTSNKIESIEKLQKEQEYIKTLKLNSKNFEDFKILRNSHKAEQINFGKLIYSFDKLLNKTVNELKTHNKQAEAEIESFKLALEHNKPTRDKTVAEMASLQAEILTLFNEKKPEKGAIFQKEEFLKEIDEIIEEASLLHHTAEEVVGFLEEKMSVLKLEEEKIGFALQSIKMYDSSQKSVEDEIKDCNEKIIKLEGAIGDSENLFINHVSSNQNIARS